jgi:hypothetical protein
VNLKIKTNVARAFLAAAQTFKQVHNVIWEYVANELQYRDPKVPAKIFVVIEKDKISIAGNGSGMDENDLEHFFTLHGENRERARGSGGRGKFGTGKSSAFAIANSLNITSCKNNKEFKFNITRKYLKKYEKTGENIPLEECILVNGKKVLKPNGTIFELENFFEGIKINNKEIISFIEKHIKKYKGAEIWVNNYLCQIKEPIFKLEKKFNSIENGFKKIGNINLILRSSPQPLEKEDQGVSILSNGHLHEMTLGGVEGKEMANYIFGEIDCPLLDQDNQDISPYSMSRDMTLVKHNPIVRELHNFIGLKAEELRAHLLQEHKENKKTEQAQKLQKVADKIALRINDHFRNYIDKIKMNIARRSDGRTDFMQAKTGFDKTEDNQTLTTGNELNALLNTFQNFDLNNSERNNRDKNKNNKKPNIDKNKEKKAKKTEGGGNKKSSGGSNFKIDYQRHGVSSPRAKYVAEENTVYINLDHPYISSISQEDESFRFTEVTSEIAYTEYAMGLVNLLYNNKYYKDATDEYLQEVRIIVNALSIPQL